jgi:guanine deaminase
VLIRASLLHTPAFEELHFEADGGLVVDGQGAFSDAGPFEEVAARHPGLPVEDLRPFWILPGLVDLHAHLPQYEAVAADGLELLPWLERHIYPAEERFSDLAHASATARRYLKDVLSLGTTTAVLYATIHAEATDAIFQEAEACGIRAVIGKTMMDRHAPGPLLEDTETTLRESEELCRVWHGRDGGRLHYAFTPRFAPSCSRELMLGAGRLAQTYDAFIQTHLAENLQELEWVRQLFPEADSYTDVYRRFGLLSARTLLGHGIHLGPLERDVIRESGSSLVHCPSSNAFLQSGTMPLRRWLEEGLSVGLGTDVGAGPSLSMFREMGEACTASKLRRASQQVQSARLRPMPGLTEPQKLQVIEALDLEPTTALNGAGAFYLATRGGARALGLGDRLGALEAGFEADFLVVDVRLSDPFGQVAPDPAQVLSRLLYRSDPRLVQAAYVRGKRCFHRPPNRLGPGCQTDI